MKRSIQAMARWARRRKCSTAPRGCRRNPSGSRMACSLRRSVGTGSSVAAAGSAWMTNQFLYGEVTGIQCGHWLYRAPDLEAARFFSRQAVEEFQHVENFVRILELLGEPPAPAHRMVRFLSTGMMPGSFEEHVCLEMALGEGFVLMALYGVIDKIG